MRLVHWARSRGAIRFASWKGIIHPHYVPGDGEIELSPGTGASCFREHVYRMAHA
jgi:hypothetical protein